MQLVSGKDKFNACQVSLLWLNSFLVSLWTFQPTLVDQKEPSPHYRIQDWWKPLQGMAHLIKQDRAGMGLEMSSYWLLIGNDVFRRDWKANNSSDDDYDRMYKSHDNDI